jgi:group I intron endonuclease
MNDKVIKGVYCLTSPSGKRYVGVGMGKKGIKGRWDRYRCLGCKKQTKLYNALKKHGTENFKYEVVLVTDDVDRAKRVEKQLIALWNLQNNNYGYNITEGGDSSQRGRKWKLSEVAKNNIRNAVLKRGKRSKEYCDNISKSKLGKKRNAETIEKMRRASTGKSHSEETKNKISNSMMGKNNWMKGKTWKIVNGKRVWE